MAAASPPPSRRNGPAQTPRLGRPPLIDRATVVAAAVDVGFEALTATAVAGRLGVGLSTLYRVFPNRTALAAAAVEQVVASQDWPPAPQHAGPGWRAFLAHTTWAAWNLYDRHPGLAAEVASLAFAPPSLVAVAQRSIEVLVDAGFAARDALLIVDMAGELALGPFLLARDLPAAPAPAPGPGPVSDREDLVEGPIWQSMSVLDRVATQRRQLLSTTNPVGDGPVHDVFAAVIHDDPRHWLQAKLDLFLDAATVRRGMSPPVTPPAAPAARGQP
ncbi:TetR family transcriptional regulator [Parafrankia sp. FMc2]|uniref:TetR family transcriptional regulator n=1 Tax=Parafrankia sp. FMc2 TaxID=3233196 RepID=UPI0034D50F63